MPHVSRATPSQDRHAQLGRGSRLRIQRDPVVVQHAQDFVEKSIGGDNTPVERLIAFLQGDVELITLRPDAQHVTQIDRSMLAARSSGDPALDSVHVNLL